MAAVRPLGDTESGHAPIEEVRKTDEEAGLYVAGEGNDEDLDWIPDEMIEADAAEDEAEEVPEGREEVVIGEPCGEVRPQTWRSPVKPSAAEIADHVLFVSRPWDGKTLTRGRVRRKSPRYRRWVWTMINMARRKR